MSARRHRISLHDHGAFELVTGILTMVAPVVLSFHTAGLLAALMAGALLMGMSLDLGSRRVRTLGAHRRFDAGFGIVAATIALLLAASGDVRATLFFAALSAVHAVLSASTRYVSAG